MNYPVTVNEVAFVKITDEPVFVLEPTNQDGYITVRRCIINENKATSYENEQFLEAELLSEKARLIKELDFTAFSLDERQKYSDAYDAKRTQTPGKTTRSEGSLLN